MIIESPACWIGWDPAELRANMVAYMSARMQTAMEVFYQRLSLDRLRQRGYYTRPTQKRDSYLWDTISDAPMSTEHAISRFLVPLLSKYRGWAVFMDGDVLVRQDLERLFELADPAYAVMVVKHPDGPQGWDLKKNDQPQTIYHRKNWSSVMLWNCAHSSNRQLTREMVNGLPGRDLHRFCWLQDEEIGSLPAGWNYLVNVTTPPPPLVSLAHYTLGTPQTPEMPTPFAAEWWEMAELCGYAAPALIGGV